MSNEAEFYGFSDIYAREQGSNKKSASASCALSAVRQLFHFGVIEAYGGPQAKRKDVEQVRTVQPRPARPVTSPAMYS